MRRPLYLSDRMIEALAKYHNMAGFFFANKLDLESQGDYINPQQQEDILDLHDHIGKFLAANEEKVASEVK